MHNIFAVLQEYQTEVFSGIIVLLYIYFRWYIRKKRKKNEFIANLNLIEAFPSILSTMGVLFTFVGIVWGLWNFNTSNISASVPALLEGLKMAFLTSILGMITSMLMGRSINKEKDKLESKLSASTELGVLKEIHLSMQHLLSKEEEAQERFIDRLNSLAHAIQASNASQEKQLAQLQTMGTSIDKVNKTVKESCITQQLSLQETAGQTEKVTAEIKNVSATLGNVIDLEDAQASIQNESLEEIKSLSSVVRSEILAVTDAMDKSNKLMESKFDEFSDLMRKNNVEALVEVMSQVTVEFNRQMKTLIDKLVKENFDELNKSVAQLNTWQQENKQMIDDLTSQYTQMTADFEKTSTILERVADNTHTLVSEDSKLQLMIEELRKLMVDDKKFTQIVEMLNESVEKVEKGTMSFEEATSSLNTWISNHRDIGDGVRLLVKRLDEINKIKDYNEDFWKGTKASLDEGLSVVINASKHLNESVSGLNEEFYERLNSTLVNLDSCIQAMYEKQNQ